MRRSFVAAVGITTRWIADSSRARPLPRTLLNAATILIATEAASLTYGALGAATAPFTWPWQAAPIAAGPDLATVS